MNERSLLKIKHSRLVPVREEWKPFLWSYQKEAPLEKVIIAVCRYGKFEDLEKLYSLYPEETEETVLRRNDINRGIKFWIKRWKMSRE